MPRCRLFLLTALASLLPVCAAAQGTAADYARANTLPKKFAGLALHIPGPANWIAGTDHFWYHTTVPGGTAYEWVDAVHRIKRPAFDQARLAAALSQALGKTYSALILPFHDPVYGFHYGPRTETGLRFIDNETAIRFGLNGSFWRCDLTSYTCAPQGKIPAPRRPFYAPPPPPVDPGLNPPAMLDNDVVDGVENLVPDASGSPESAWASPYAANAAAAQAMAAHPPVPPHRPGAPTFKRSPDGRWEAVIENFNVFLRRTGSKQATALSYDGSEGNYYSLRTLTWSPNSRYLVAYATTPGYQRHIHYVESSPANQVQPIAFIGPLYRKAGDVLPIAHPALFDVATCHEIEISNKLFPNPYDLTLPKWWKDSRGFTFEYNQRGHQVYRVIEVSATTGVARTLIDETSKTFIDYRPLVPNPTDTGKRFRYDVNDGREIIWASERDGWEHLYLYNGLTGQIENKITSGDWPVRAVNYVDPVKRQIWFEASGTIPDQDPYFIQYYRINFDGTGLVQYTSANGDHSVQWSPDRKYYVDTWSQVDVAPTMELRRTSNQKVLLPLEHGDLKPLLAAGWMPPMVFHAKGRDGVTDIWGVIYRPTNFDPAKKYPVVETIYAGPQGNFVPKTFSGRMQPLAELGFIVVQIDGMGTNNRSRAFHDVAWKNLVDAGFPDRILWHEAAAKKFPWYDIGRGVGIYGTSAGGQSALAALEFHPKFYTVGVANSGCYDNRMDKIWWNEQYMGWPVGPQYIANSDTVNAWRLQGKLLLVMGELDDNVDPSSTLQVVNQLIRHNKHFDFLEVPGGGHGAGGAYYQHLFEDFFVHNMLHVEPPRWNYNGKY